MSIIDPARSLGAYMRTVGAQLSHVKPMSFTDALVLIPNQDLGYAAATLIRLEQRGVAMQTIPHSYLFLRGPQWHAAATHYKWEVADHAQEE